jgi:tetraacyldisaccharide 4'-kinase
VTGRLQRFARRWWAGGYGRRGLVLSLILAPLSWLWVLAATRRARRFEREGGQRVDGLRVVSIGNLAVGGTGKTPLAAWVARRLLDCGARPALALRGYGRDEALLHGLWNPGVPVFLDADRVRAARRAAEGGAGTVVLDDGFQHRGLVRDVDLVLLSVDDPFPAAVLPCGPYREPIAALARADAVVLTRRAASADEARSLAAEVHALPGIAPGAVVASVHIAVDQMVPLGAWAETAGEGTPPAEPAELAGHGPNPGTYSLDPSRGVLAVTGIARPDAFRVALQGLFAGRVDVEARPDHHEFTEREARGARARAGDRPIVMTEKDAVKLIDHAELLGDAWVLRSRLAWDWGEAELRALVLPGDS